MISIGHTWLVLAAILTSMVGAYVSYPRHRLVNRVAFNINLSMPPIIFSAIEIYSANGILNQVILESGNKGVKILHATFFHFGFVVAVTLIYLMIINNLDENKSNGNSKPLIISVIASLLACILCIHSLILHVYI